MSPGRGSKVDICFLVKTGSKFRKDQASSVGTCKSRVRSMQETSDEKRQSGIVRVVSYLFEKPAQTTDISRSLLEWGTACHRSSSLHPAG